MLARHTSFSPPPLLPAPCLHALPWNCLGTQLPTHHVSAKSNERSHCQYNKLQRECVAWCCAWCLTWSFSVRWVKLWLQKKKKAGWRATTTTW